jgi:hypothetical protein
MKGISKPRHGFRNSLLKNLPAAVLIRLRPHLKKVELNVAGSDSRAGLDAPLGLFSRNRADFDPYRSK